MADFARRVHTTFSAHWLAAIIFVTFAWSAWRAKWISDDGYIYLTYVQNLTENGAGPVFNSGERVEAFTSTAWFMLLSAVNVIRPDGLLTMRQMTLVVSIGMSALALALWPAVEARAHRTLGAVGSTPMTMIPMATMAGTYLFRSFATSGLETPLQLLWLMTVLMLVWSNLNTRRHAIIVALAAGLGPLIRPDLAIVSVFLVGLLTRRVWRHHDRRTVAACAAAVFVPLAATTAVRIVVYGQLVQNTFYAKGGTTLGFSQGFDYLRDLTAATHVELVALLALGLVMVAAYGATQTDDPRSPEPLPSDGGVRRRVFLLVAAGTHGLYVLSVGGDFMHGRFWITSFVLLLGSSAGLDATLSRAWADRFSGLRPETLRAAGAVVTAVALVSALGGSTRQQRDDLSPFGIIDGIADEADVYATLNPTLHHWTDPNLSTWAQTGRELRELARLLGFEVGIARPGIGQIAFEGQAGPQPVYVFDTLSLTQQAGARTDTGTARVRIGHATPASEPLIALNQRVDFHQTTFPDFNEVFRISLGSQTVVLVNFALIDPLRDLGMIDDARVLEMERFLASALAAPTIDRNLLTLLSARYERPDAIRARLDELDDIERTSTWREWLAAHGETLDLLDNTGCSSLCVERAIERHRAPKIPLLVNAPDMVVLDR